VTQSLADRFFVEAMSPEVRRDPHPYYERFRGPEPLLRAAETVWFCLGHAEVTTLLRHPRLSSDETRATRNVGNPSAPGRALSLLGMDPPEHTRLRGLVARAFTPRRLDDLRAATEAIAQELLDGMAERGGTVDLVQAFAYPLPVRVICALLGVPPADEALFTEWSRGLARSVDPVVLRTAEIEATIKASQQGLAAYIADLLAERRRSPGDDLLSALAAVDVGGDSITAREIVALAELLLFAGHETTVNLIGNSVLALLQAPDQLALLRQSPGLIGAAVDEFLRFDSPVQFSLRIVADDMELVGAPVKAGDEVMLILAAANHDAAVFADPHHLDVRRDARRHVSFGGGIHHCLGATLARMEGEIALQLLLQRFASIELAGTPTRLPTFTLRGLDTFPVALRS
jgi:cytochrome P450